MKWQVRIDATLTLELGRRQIEALNHLASYGGNLVRALRSAVTQEVSERDLVDLFAAIEQQTAPVVRALRQAEALLRAEPKVDHG